MFTTELTNLLRDSDYLIWYCSALDDLHTVIKKRRASTESKVRIDLDGTIYEEVKVIDTDTKEVIQILRCNVFENDNVVDKFFNNTNALRDQAKAIVHEYEKGVPELVKGYIHQEIWKYPVITGIYISEFFTWPRKVLRDQNLSNSKVKYEAIQAVCPNKSRLTFTKSDLLQIYEAAKIIDYERVRKLVDASKQEIKKWIMKYTDGEYFIVHYRELVDILEGKCETLS